MSKLQLVGTGGEGAEEGQDERGSVNTAQGLVQLQPICLLEPDERRVAHATLTGFRLELYVLRRNVRYLEFIFTV